MHAYEVPPARDNRSVDSISHTLPFGRLWYGGVNAISNAIGYAQFYSRSHNVLIRVYDHSDNVLETDEHKGGSQDNGL